jgi:hypothetical protein
VETTRRIAEVKMSGVQMFHVIGVMTIYRCLYERQINESEDLILENLVNFAAGAPTLMFPRGLRNHVSMPALDVLDDDYVNAFMEQGAVVLQDIIHTMNARDSPLNRTCSTTRVKLFCLNWIYTYHTDPDVVTATKVLLDEMAAVLKKEATTGYWS